MTSGKPNYTGLTVRLCLLRTGVQDRTYESQSGNQYTILGMRADKPSAIVVYTNSGRESSLSLEKMLNDREVAVHKIAIPRRL